MTLQVTGTNFPTQAAILWNGSAITTTAVDSNTLSGKVDSSSLATPGTVQLQVQNTQTMQASQAVPVVIAPAGTNTPSPLTISTTPLPQGVVSTPYSGTLGVSGGTSPYTWSVTTGQLPAGLSLAANTGIISGTPTASGNYSFGVTVVDSGSSPQSASSTVSISVGAAPANVTALIVNTSSLPSGTIGTGYSASLQASGGTAPYTWSFVSGNFPGGLSLNPSTGTISGTPTAIGTVSLTVAVADSSSPVQTKSVTLSITIAPQGLAIATSALPSGTVGTAYSTVLQATGGASPYTWSVSGSLPAGLSLASSTGIISGTPTAAGTANLTATVADAENPAQTKSVTLSLVVVPSTLTITSSALPGGTQNSTYSTALQATGGTGSYTWSISSGSLPAGLSLASSTGVISGKPTGNGSFSFGVTAKDAGSPAQTASATVTLTVVQAGAALAIGTASLPAGVPNQAYSTTLSATGGTSPYTWSLTSGTLPSGLGLAASTGIISGNPTASSTTSLTFKVVDSSSPAQSKAVTLSLVVAPTALSITTSSLPSGTNGTTYSNLMQAMGGTTPYTWSISGGSLPAGLTLSSSTGLISGTPTTTGTSSFTVSVKDAGSPATQSTSVKLSIVIAAAPPAPLTISTTGLSSGTKGSSYASSLQAGGGTTPYAWSISAGSLPAGLTLSSTTGLISGTPTGTGTSSFTATVTDAGSPAQTQSVKLSIVVAAPTPTALTVGTTLPSGTVGTAYSSSITASGGTSPYTWSLASGNIPAGLSMNTSTGLVSGTPTTSGTSSFTVTVTDSGSPAQSQSPKLSIVVAPAASSALTISASLPAGTVGTAYSNPMTASGGTPAYTWSISAGSLPPGLTLAATTGIISGTPSTTGTYNFTAAVSDNSSPAQTQSAATSIVVGSAQTTNGPGTTWFVRPDGGTRYSSNVPAGQCDGLADVAYPGTGTNQHCAFNDFRYMWDDDSGMVGQGAWIIAGGDTVVIRGCTALSTQMNPANPTCRIGWDINTGGGSSNQWCTNIGNNTCYNPPIPAGTATQHTRILGGCAYGGYSCSPVNTYPITSNNLTQIFGGMGLTFTFNLQNTQYLDIEGLEITTHNGVCVSTGSPAYPRYCSTSAPVDDFSNNGVMFNNKSSNILLQDVYIHGFNQSGLYGPIGGPIAMTRVFSGFGGFAGWNFQDNSNTPNAAGSSITASYVTMIGNGCYEQYPIKNAGYPAQACYDDVSNGFGDSWSGQDTNLDSFTCDHCVQMYNTKDGFIGPHAAIATLSITNSTSIGNMGQQWKWGGQVNGTSLFQNNITVGNCGRMIFQLPGASQTFAKSSGLPGAYLSDFCRAAGNTFDILVQNGSKNYFYGNTTVMADPTGIDYDCGPAGGGATNCGAVVNLWQDNLFLGYTDPGLGSAPGLWYITPGTNVVVTSTYNYEFGIRAGDQCGTNNVTCSDPLMVSEPASPWPGALTDLDVFNPFVSGNSFTPSSGSPLIGAGTAATGLTTDYNGKTRPNPPSIGAIEP